MTPAPALSEAQLDDLATLIAAKVVKHQCSLGLTQDEAEFLKRGAAISRTVKNVSLTTAIGAIVLMLLGALGAGLAMLLRSKAAGQ